MGALLSGVLLWFRGIFAVLFGYKLFFGGLLMTILFVGAYNLVVEIFTELLNFGLSAANDAVSGAGITEPSKVIAVAGLGAWFVAHLQLVPCLSWVLGCILLKFLLRKIPFIRW